MGKHHSLQNSTHTHNHPPPKKNKGKKNNNKKKCNKNSRPSLLSNTQNHSSTLSPHPSP